MGRRPLSVVRIVGLVAVMTLALGALGISSSAPSEVQVQIEHDAIRVQASAPSVADMRLQVHDLSGTPVYDSGFRDGRTLTWRMRTEAGAAVAHGVYLAVITARDQQGRQQARQVRKLVVQPDGVQAGPPREGAGLRSLRDVEENLDSAVVAQRTVTIDDDLNVTGDVQFQSLTDCDTIDTDGNGNLFCGTDADTSVSAGTGLSKSGSTLSIASGGVGANEIDSTAVQERVSGSCDGEFEAIRAIKQDGSVECVTIVPVLPGGSAAALGSSADVERITDKLAAQAERIDSQAQKIEQLKQTNAEMKATIRSQGERIQQLQAQMNALMERVEALEAEASE